MAEEGLRPYLALHQRIARKEAQEILMQAVRQNLADGVPLLSAPIAGLMYTLARVASAQAILEVGTGYGYSTALLSLACPAAMIVTVERDQRCVEKALNLFMALGIERRIALMHGEAIDIVRHLYGPFDLAFLDAAKEEYVAYLEALLPHLRSGALLVADDVFFTGETPSGRLPDAHSQHITMEIARFRRVVSEMPGLVTSLLPVGCGVSVSLTTGLTESLDDST